MMRKEVPNLSMLVYEQGRNEVKRKKELIPEFLSKQSHNPVLRSHLQFSYKK